MLETFGFPRLALQLALLAVGMTLVVAAGRRGWRPSLTTTLLAAAVLRGVMLMLSVDMRPYDLVNDFHRAGENVLAHRDPTLHSRETGWNYLPTYALFLGINVWVERHLGVPWLVISRLGPILFDLGVVVLVGALAGWHGALRRFQYACFPLPIMVSAVHGQMEPLCLLFAVGAFVLILRAGRELSGNRAVAAGALLGLAISVKSWPALLLPALLLGLPNWRGRLRALVGAGSVLLALFATMPLTVGTPVRALPKIAGAILSYHPNPGTWGWSSVALWLHPVHPLAIRSDPFAVTIGRIGSAVTLAAVIAAVWWWRRGHPTDVAMVSTSSFQVATAAHGMQYLTWPLPFAVARPTRWTNFLGAVTGVYAAIGYFVFGAMTSGVYRELSLYYFVGSLIVIPFIVLSLPWKRRRWRQDTEQLEAEKPQTDAPVMIHALSSTGTRYTGSHRPGIMKSGRGD